MALTPTPTQYAFRDRTSRIRILNIGLDKIADNKISKDPRTDANKTKITFYTKIIKTAFIHQPG